MCCSKKRSSFSSKNKQPPEKKPAEDDATGADWKPVLTHNKLMQMIQRLKERRKARKRIAEEEKQYIEFRRKELLARNRGFGLTSTKRGRPSALSDFPCRRYKSFDCPYCRFRIRLNKLCRRFDVRAN
ncbi:hypothetical protein QR680_006681 [Steinernema hermaphroditum]|uniref:Uncharacterized protein n=1 Tax=Steinernema hermaphroditum TaxID=289476 RepID=A0AA39HWB4_9BILA|nr:hypothetical protein QR680_006681 [Steinernema hermaphroditum]